MTVWQEVFMSKSKWFQEGKAALALVFGMGLLACPVETPEEPKEAEWLAVTSLDQLDGIWKGVTHETMPFKKTSIIIYDDTEITMTIDATDKTMAMTMTTTQTYSGKGIDEIWETFREEIKERLEEECLELVFNDETHSVTIAATQPATELEPEVIAKLLGKFQINQAGTQLKSRLDTDNREIILTRQ
jgi:hypothetical protein